MANILLLAQIFQDTKKCCQNDPALVQATQLSKAAARLYPAQETYCPPAQQDKNGSVRITKQRTYEAACQLHMEFPDKRIGVLNFASAVQPGGGVAFGATAQEESLCRCSNLYPVLDQPAFWDTYYNPNRRAHNYLNTDACIYAPDIVVFKSDTASPKLLPEEKWVRTDVITCAAPELHRLPFATIENDKLYALHIKRGGAILSCAVQNKIDCLVLGAFGCGAFHNPPDIVAQAYAAILPQWKKCFERIEFAIYCGRSETENYRSFSSIITQE